MGMRNYVFPNQVTDLIFLWGWEQVMGHFLWYSIFSMGTWAWGRERGSGSLPTGVLTGAWGWESEDGGMRMGAWGWKHWDGSMQTEAWGWEHGDESNFLVTFYFQKKTGQMIHFLYWYGSMWRAVIICFIIHLQNRYFGGEYSKQWDNGILFIEAWGWESGDGRYFSCIFLNFFQMIVSHGSENMCGWESVNVSVWMVWMGAWKQECTDWSMGTRVMLLWHSIFEKESHQMIQFFILACTHGDERLCVS